VVKLTFMRGASVEDPTRHFNASLQGGTRRAADLVEGADLDDHAFRGLIGAAVALNAGLRERKPGPGGHVEKR